MAPRLLLGIACSLAVGALAAGALAAGGGPSPGAVQGWDGVAAPGGGVRYVAMPAGRSTVVAAVNVYGGRIVRFGSLAGSWGVPLVAYDGSAGGLSADGRLLVLAEASQAGFRAVSRFAVLGTKGFRVRRQIVLRGEFSFDALSPDSRTLYVIEHVSEQDFSRYRVRAYDLRAGRLLAGAIADKRSDETTMAGYPVTRATSPDGGWVYTLYRNDAGHPFIHALDTRGRRAVCIDLPWRGSQDALFGLRLSAGADEIVLRRFSGSVVATVDARTFEVRT